MDDFMGNFGPLIDAASNVIFMLVVFLSILGGAFYVWRMGLLTRYDYNCPILVERDGKRGEIILGPKGRYKKNGKFEIKYSSSDKVETQAPSDRYIQPKNVIPFVRDDMENHRPCHFNFRTDTDVNIEGSMSPAAKLAFANETKESALRFTKRSWLDKFADKGALIVAAVILGLVFIVGVNAVAGPLTESANAQIKSAEAISNLAEQLEGSSGSKSSEPYKPPYPPG